MSAFKLEGEDVYEAFLFVLGVIIIIAALSFGGYFYLFTLFGAYAIIAALYRTVKQVASKHAQNSSNPKA